MTGVNFIQTDRELASARLRNLIPMAELRKLGYEQGNDVLVLSKDNWTWDDRFRDQYGKIIFDICDDWFGHETKGQHYHNACEKADLITCNSAAMQARIVEATGRQATVIDDPYEEDELPPSSGENICWFGHKINLPDLIDNIGAVVNYKVSVVSNAKGCIPWSMEAQRNAIDACRLVFLPTGRRICKSANRAVTATRRGKFVVTGDIACYREIPGLWVGNMMEGIEWGMNTDTTEHVLKAQSYVRERFSPEKVGKAWDTAIRTLLAN